jgi:hypothetical protein
MSARLAASSAVTLGKPCWCGSDRSLIASAPRALSDLGPNALAPAPGPGYLPRLKGSAVILDAIREGLRLLTWSHLGSVAIITSRARGSVSIGRTACCRRWHGRCRGAAQSRLCRFPRLTGAGLRQAGAARSADGPCTCPRPSPWRCPRAAAPA